MPTKEMRRTKTRMFGIVIHRPEDRSRYYDRVARSWTGRCTVHNFFTYGTHNGVHMRVAAHRRADHAINNQSDSSFDFAF